MQDTLATAIDAHQAGQIGPASQLYQQILAREPENVDALHMLGVLRHQCGDHDRAVALMVKAVGLNPRVPALYSNLAEAYRALGQFERATDCCRMALRLCPEYPEAECNLGLALQGLGRHGEACEHFRRSLQSRPDFAGAQSNLGISLRELGDLEAALTHFHRAVELAPNSASARTNLGQALLDGGQAHEALPHCREAVRLQPKLAALHHNLGNACRALDQLAEAGSAYREAIRLDPTLAQSHGHLGLILQREGQRNDALICMTTAVELAPDDPLLWEHLAELHVDREDGAEAIRCWQQVLALKPDLPTAHNGLGWALKEEGRLSEAAEHFRTALRLQADFAAAQVNLGGVHEELGELPEAEAAFRAALRMQPSFAMPHGRLATLLRGNLSDADQFALEERLADPLLEDGPRARLQFGLAHVLDARDDWLGAADLLVDANASTLELARRQHRAYVPADHERFVDGLIRVFTPAFFARLARAGDDTRRPVFIFGLPRSGTTLIEQVLASHSQIHGAGELRFTRQSFEAIPTVVDRANSPLLCMQHLDSTGLRTLADRHLAMLASLDAGQSARVVDKMPDNYLYLGWLAVLFPNATFIHCRRDLRDVAVSCWMTDFRTLRWTNSFEHIVTRFKQYRRLMDHLQTVLPTPIHEVNYEDTVADLEGVAWRLVAACGLDWEPECLDFHRLRRPVRTASVTQVRQPIYKQSLARWKNYETPLADLFRNLPSEPHLRP